MKLQKWNSQTAAIHVLQPQERGKSSLNFFFTPDNRSMKSWFTTTHLQTGVVLCGVTWTTSTNEKPSYIQITFSEKRCS